MKNSMKADVTEHPLMNKNGTLFLGQYFDFQMKDPAMLPAEEAIKTIALTVMRFVWPDVDIPTHERKMTNGAIPQTSEGGTRRSGFRRIVGR